MKLTPEELNSITDINNRFSSVFFDIGQVSVKISEYSKLLEDAEEEKKTLYKDYLRIREDESLLAKQLTDKYGTGKLDLNTGEILPE